MASCSSAYRREIALAAAVFMGGSVGSSLAAIGASSFLAASAAVKSCLGGWGSLALRLPAERDLLADRDDRDARHVLAVVEHEEFLELVGSSTSWGGRRACA